MSNFQKESAGYLANHMARLFALGLQNRLQHLGLAPAQFMVLLELWREDGRTQVDLVRALDVEQATMANTLKRMERDDLILRKASKSDARARLIFLTERARGMEEEAKAAARAQNQIAMAGIEGEDRARFLDLMRQVIANMKRG